MKRPKPRRFQTKIKSREQLQPILKKLKSKKIVFTNGCFDILHKGHVTYLQQARALGEVLVVALNSDQSVKKIKGKSRPINPLADRIDVMASLECVDYVTWFGEDNPLKTILLLKPTILVKGGDWKASQMIGAKEVLSWGGKVKSLRYVLSKSTTEIIARAKLAQ